jgi:hypothetical protein
MDKFELVINTLPITCKIDEAFRAYIDNLSKETPCLTEVEKREVSKRGTMTEMKDLIGTTGELNLPGPIRCSRCLSNVPPVGLVEVVYLGKGEDDITHEVRDEFRFLNSLRCPFCGAVIATVFLNAIAAPN